MLQSVVFPKDKFTITQTKTWLKNHRITPMKAAHVTNTSYRYRINPPPMDGAYYTIHAGNVNLVYSKI